MRLDKFLCEVNQGTRSQVKAFIRKGLVTVNGKTVTAPDTQIQEKSDEIVFQGRQLAYAPFRYYMLNKPKGVVSATEDSREKTVLDLFPPELRRDLFPAGRLDKDTEGLLLLTNDGALAHNLLSPKKHVDKTYLVKTRMPISKDAVQALEQGVDIGERHPTAPAEVSVIQEKEILLTIREGKFHQIKRMLQAVGNQVMCLKRISFGSLELDKVLAPGAYRELTNQEVAALYECQKNNAEADA